MRTVSKTIKTPRKKTLTKIALVTGAAKRLGRSIALRLAQEGWDIGVHYGQSIVEAQETVLAVQGMGRRAVALQADFAQQTQVDSLVEQCTTAITYSLHDIRRRCI